MRDVSSKSVHSEYQQTIMKPKLILATSGALSVVALIVLSLATPSQSQIQARDARLRAAQSGATGASPASVGPFQSEVAADKQWNTTSSSDARLSTAIAATDIARGRSLVGQRGAIQGTVTDIFIPPGNSVMIVNFGNSRGDALMAVVKSSNYAKFPPLSKLEGKKVLIEGQFEIYRNRDKNEVIEIVLSDPNQVSVVR